VYSGILEAGPVAKLRLAEQHRSLFDSRGIAAGLAAHD
jgi:hypothetical protein